MPMRNGALANKRFSVATPPHGIIAFNRVKPSIRRNLVSGRAKRAPLVKYKVTSNAL